MPLTDALLYLWAAIALNLGLVLWALARTRQLEQTMKEQLTAIQYTLAALPTKQDMVNTNQETINAILLNLGVRPALTTIGTIQTGGGGAAVGGGVSDQRAPR